MKPLSRQVPGHFENRARLALRVLQRGGDGGRFALFAALAGVITTPLDIALEGRERQLYKAAGPIHRPLLFVCGPPRSGTSVVTQTLIRHLPVTYINNLMGIFPRAPLAATRFFRVPPRNHTVELKNHYGKTPRFDGPNDGLFVWDRWFGADRTDAKAALDRDAVDQLQRFFSALSDLSGRPVITKNNSLNILARHAAAALPEAIFVCVDREPLYLAQSLLLARRYVHGNDSRPYGIDQPRSSWLDDPLADVCRQVAFYERSASAHVEELGSNRFWRVSYEAFCAAPHILVERAAAALGLSPELRETPPPLRASQTRRLPSAEFERLAELIHPRDREADG